ncbi:MAG: PEP-utilizing enzyme [bacterium]
MWGSNYLKEKLIKDSNLTLEKLKNKLLAINNSLEKIKSEKEEIVKKYKISKKILDICNVIAKIGHFRLEMRIAGWMPIQYHLELLAEETARRFSYEPKKIKFARVQEVLNFFDGKMIERKILEDRSKNFLIFMKNRVVNIYGGEEANKKFKELVSEVDLSEVKEFKGNVAMKGRVIGTALVLKWTDNIQEKSILIKDDTILVAGQTRPQLMPLISKSKAIVTDEGGITSHAAIVSRELGIPCVIGTKIGTSVVKTGDLIEVDANIGIVRIIKKA